MIDRQKFNAWQAKWLMKCVLRGDCSPRKALRTYRNTQFIGAYTYGNPPPVGDVVWAQPNGPDFQILGRHVTPKPDGEVIP